MITGIELPHKRLDQVYSQENPIVWAKKATHSKIRFAVHDGEETHSYKEEFEIDRVLYIDRETILCGQSDPELENIEVYHIK